MIWALFFAVLLASFFFDFAFLLFLETLRNPALTAIFIFFTELGTFIAAPALLLSLVFGKKKKKFLLWPLWTSLVASFAFSYLVKEIVQRGRPLAFALIQETGYSFPSSHAAVAFALVPLLNQEYPKWKWIWYTLAGCVALSRVYLGVHYLSDVVAGGLLGFVLGKVCISKSAMKLWRK